MVGGLTMSNQWNYNQPSTPTRFDFTADFDTQIKSMKSINGGSIIAGTQTYDVLCALFDGNVIDDYENPPRNSQGFTIRNVRSRIASLRTHWNIVIGDRTKEGKAYKEYSINRAGT